MNYYDQRRLLPLPRALPLTLLPHPTQYLTRRYITRGAPVLDRYDLARALRVPYPLPRSHDAFLSLIA